MEAQELWEGDNTLLEDLIGAEKDGSHSEKDGG